MTGSFPKSPWLAAGLLAIALTSAPTRAAEPVTAVRLYTFDCGHITTTDMGPFSDTGEYDGKSGKLVDPCFLVRHPKGNFIWDTGLGDALAEKQGGVDVGSNHLEVPLTLVSQLKALDLTPADIGYVAFSHFHFDHIGNANLFTAATWILNKAELDWALQPGNPHTDVKAFSGYKTVKTEMIDGDHDVFGDGTVKILKAPGHTPGHQVLELKLGKGVVVLSGDLYHTLANRAARRVPAFNTGRADTLASMDRVERIVRNTHARFFIQHAPEDFAKLPRSPAYLD